MSAPIPFTWTGEAMKPARGFARRCDGAFVVGMTYTLDVVEDRSTASHRAYFAYLNEAWQQLPESHAARFPTPEHLRKAALIATGFATSREVVCANPAEALRWKPVMESMEEYTVATISPAGTVLTIWTAQSQSMRAMGKATFQASQRAVCEFVAALSGVSRETMAANVGRAA